MRLTLRTLLAYLDDVLEPADAQDIGKKIEDSEFAANIVHRTRDVMRRLRLGAPRLSGQGAGLDANTVAEYLDYTLPDDRVADFEKVCLQSDVHLAEVSSCHQIRVILLSEAAEVDSNLRHQIYKLVDGADQPKVNETERGKPASVAAPPTPPRPRNDVPPQAVVQHAGPRRKAEVPEYLRRPEDERSWRKPAALVALAGLLAVVLIMAIDGSWLAQQLGLGARNTTPVALNDPAESDPQEPQSAPAAVTPPTEGQPSASELQQPESVGRINPPAPPAVEAPVPATPRDALPATPEPAPPAATTEVPPSKPAEPPAAAVAATAKPPETAVPAAAPPVAGSIGRLISNSEVLLRNDPQTSTWQRVAAQELLPADQKLISLPAFRPTIALANGITLELLGGARTANRAVNQLVGTSVEFEATADGVPGIHLEYGRIVASGRLDSRLKVSAGSRHLLITFIDAEATMALEVCPIRVEGSDPEATPPQLQVALYVSRGKLSLTDTAGGQSQDVEAPAVIALGSAPVKTNELPEWIRMDQTTPLEKTGAQFVAAHLTMDRPALLGLKELAEPDVAGRRDEVRLLAAKSLARVGDFEPLVAALNQADPNYKTIWSDLINDLRAAIARGPETAVEVRKAFEGQRGDDAAALYRMLWGYSLADLRANDAKALKDLVAGLDHNDMDYRALAFWNLRELTGATLFYRPENNAEARKQHLQKWRQRLESGQILPQPKVE